MEILKPTEVNEEKVRNERAGIPSIVELLLAVQEALFEIKKFSSGSVEGGRKKDERVRETSEALVSLSAGN